MNGLELGFLPCLFAPRFEQWVEPPCEDRQIYRSAHPANRPGCAGPALHGRLYGQWRDPLPPCVVLSGNRCWSVLCEKTPHGIRILGIGADESAPRVPLEDDVGMARKLVQGAIPTAHRFLRGAVR